MLGPSLCVSLMVVSLLRIFVVCALCKHGITGCHHAISRPSRFSIPVFTPLPTARLARPCSFLPRASSGVGGVVRLCGARGLEPALGMTRRGGFGKRVLPVVITGRAPGPARASGSARPASLPDGALAAVAECSPRPCYYRIDPERLFCREAWQPVASAIAEAVSLRGRQMLLVIEADTLSSDLPQALLAHPGQVPPTQRTGDGGSEDSGRLGADQAVWGLAMLRKALEEGERRGRVASVVLAETRVACLEESTVIIDARAALLLSILSWAQQCAGETVANAGGEPVEDIASDDGAGVIETVTAASTRGGGVERKSLALEARSAVASSSSRPIAEESKVDDGAETENAGESASVESAQETSAASRVLGVLEQMGRGVRVVIAPDGRLRSTINRSLGFLSNWLEKRRLVGAGGGISRVLVYDTDDDDSFRWLATQVTATVGSLERTFSVATHCVLHRVGDCVSTCGSCIAWEAFLAFASTEHRQCLSSVGVSREGCARFLCGLIFPRSCCAVDRVSKTGRFQPLL